MRLLAFSDRAFARLCALLLPLLLFAVALTPSSALAHGGHGSASSQTFGQEIGPYDISVTVELPFAVPSTVYLATVVNQDIGELTITYRAAPRGQSFENGPSVVLVTDQGSSMVYYNDFPIDRAGPWEIEVTVDGPLGVASTRLPVTVVVAPWSWQSIALMITLAVMIVLLLVGITITALAQKRNQPMAPWLKSTISHLVFGGLVLLAVFGTQQFLLQRQEALAAEGVALPGESYGRPHVNVAMRSDPVEPLPNQPVQLVFNLNDGSSGLPVDDIVTHHDSLMHLLIISEDNGDFHHVHPARVAPGEYVVSFTPRQSGEYTAYVEVERQDSGTQLIPRRFVVGGDIHPAAPQYEGFTTRTFGDLEVAISSNQEAIRAGRQVTFSFDFSRNGQPELNVRPWLGMAGHLIARTADGAELAHVHAVAAMAPSEPILAASTIYGPRVQFAYTFPSTGEYTVWAQFKVHDEIITLPMAIQVGE